MDLVRGERDIFFISQALHGTDVTYFFFARALQSRRDIFFFAWLATRGSEFDVTFFFRAGPNTTI